MKILYLLITLLCLACSTCKIKEPILLVTNKAPDFQGMAVMPDNSFEKISLSQYHGSYIILFFYPGDFTFICPTEIIAFNKRLDEFKKRDCIVIGASVDSVHSHLAWKKLEPEQGGIGMIRYPLLSDQTKQISKSYGILFDNSVALRGLFLIDRQGIIRHSLVNDMSMGRSIDEALRVLDAARFSDTHGELCPVNWHAGQKGIKVKDKKSTKSKK